MIYYFSRKKFRLFGTTQEVDSSLTRGGDKKFIALAQEDFFERLELSILKSDRIRILLRQFCSQEGGPVPRFKVDSHSPNSVISSLLESCTGPSLITSTSSQPVSRANGQTEP